MQTISILGSGWLGLPLARKLCSQQFNINISSRSSRRFKEFNGLNPFVINIDALNDSNFFNASVLIIAITSKNVNAFSNLVEMIKLSSIKKIIFISSTSVYKNSKYIVTESDELVESPLVEIERLFKQLKNITILRFAGLIGYDRNPGKFFRNGKVVQNPSSGVNLIHQDDCIAIITQIIEQNIWNETLNCCADTHPSKKEFYTHFANECGEKVPTFSEIKNEFGKIISNEKLKKKLNYTLIHSDLMKIKF